MYYLEKDKVWLERMFKAYVDLFTHGGIRFYPLAMQPAESIRALIDGNMLKERDILMDYLVQNAEYIMSLGTKYPNLEVNFEDNIVIPAGYMLLGLYDLTGEDRYLLEAKKHVKIHDMFVGYQPDARMHAASVHHWDDFWFGKRRLYGDTYPHYWSTAGAMLYAYMGKLTDDASYIAKARACMRTCLSCFFEDGSATCAIFTPYSSNGIPGDFIDPWANDQDWAMFFAYIFNEDFGL